MPLSPGVNRIGRHPANDQWIEDPTISGYHCELIVSSDAVLVRDLGSTNGTFIDGQPVQEASLIHGQILRLGSVEMALDGQRVEISIPTLSHPRPPGSVLADGLVACANHESSAATVECPQCNRSFCELCLHQIRRVGGAALTLCPSCGGHCRPIARELPVAKRKSKIGSWLGNVTAKMTGRFARPGGR